MALIKRKRKKKEQLDKLDMDIIAELQRDSSRTVKQLKAILKKPATTIHFRIEKLVQQKVVKKQMAIVDFKKLGLGTTVILLVKLSSRKSPKELADRLRKIPSISSISIISGDYQVMAKAHFKNNESLEKFLYDPRIGIRSWDLVHDLKTILVFSEEEKPVLLIPSEVGKLEKQEIAETADTEKDR